MARLKEGLKDIKTLPLINKARYIISQVSENFSPPPLQLAEVIIATNELQQAMLNASRKDSYLIKVKNQKRKELLLRLKSLGGWVTCASMGSAIIIQSSGFDVCRGNAPLGMLSAPSHMRTMLTKTPGCLLVRWKPVHGAKSYVVEINRGNLQDEKQWIQVANVTASKATVTNLESNEKYWVRVRTACTAGISGPSIPVPGLVW